MGMGMVMMGMGMGTGVSLPEFVFFYVLLSDFVLTC